VQAYSGRILENKELKADQIKSGWGCFDVFLVGGLPINPDRAEKTLMSGQFVRLAIAHWIKRYIIPFEGGHSLCGKKPSVSCLGGRIQ
jgi:hypothetical protein